MANVSIRSNLRFIGMTSVRSSAALAPSPPKLKALRRGSLIPFLASVASLLPARTRQAYRGAAETTSV